jgi:hypothetical protein
VRKRYVAPLLACLTLAGPASASAHARTATVALDYRLVLDPATRTLAGVRVGILDGDRELRITARTAPVVVLGDLHEPMLRIDRAGAWANRASPTAVAARLVTSGSGWRKIGGSTFAWHDHRLAPPPYDSGRPGTVARFHVPIRIGGHPAAVSGAFVRYRRPAVWPWALAALLGFVAALGVGRLRPSLRPVLTIVLGAVAGLAAVGSLASFGVADSPTGRVAWAQLALGAFVAVAAATGLVRLRADGRGLLAALIGAAAAATTLGSLGVFRHAVVISSFPPFLARSVCALAFAAGAAAAVTGLQPRGRRA